MGISATLSGFPQVSFMLTEIWLCLLPTHLHHLRLVTGIIEFGEILMTEVIRRIIVTERTKLNVLQRIGNKELKIAIEYGVASQLQNKVKHGSNLEEVLEEKKKIWKTLVWVALNMCLSICTTFRN